MISASKVERFSAASLTGARRFSPVVTSLYVPGHGAATQNAVPLGLGV